MFRSGVAGLLRLVMGLVEISLGHGEVVRGGDGGGFRWILLWISNGVNLIGWTLVGFWILHGWTLVLLGFAFFFFFFLIWVFVSVGFWWALGSGGVVSMVEAW